MFGSVEGAGVEGNNYPQWRSQDFNLGRDKIKREKRKEKRLKAKLF